MAGVFFPSNSIRGCDAMMLLSGPPSCGKTSLLFQFAFNCASQNSGSAVVFICNRQRLEGTDPSSDLLQSITMKYVEDGEEIKKYFAAFHLHDTLPSAVIVDGFGDFFDDRNCQYRYGNPRGRDLAMSRTLALCRDAITQANEKRQPTGICKLLIADTYHGDNPRSLFIYKRWIPCIFTIKGDASGSFILKESSSSTSCREPQGKTVAKYSIALQHLALEEIINE